MPTLTCSLTLTHGDAVSPNVPLRTTRVVELTYTEEAIKRVRVAASQTDFAIGLDSVTAPKVLFIAAIDVDVTVKLSDQTDAVPTLLTAGSGYVCITSPNGQPINEILVTTPASPTSGALVEILAFE